MAKKKSKKFNMEQEKNQNKNTDQYYEDTHSFIRVCVKGRTFLHM